MARRFSAAAHPPRPEPTIVAYLELILLVGVIGCYPGRLHSSLPSDMHPISPSRRQRPLLPLPGSAAGVLISRALPTGCRLAPQSAPNSKRPDVNKKVIDMRFDSSLLQS